MAAHQASPSLGFSRQEHWSGLPFSSPMHESGKWKLTAKSLSRVRLLATPWTAAYQAPPSMGFSRQEYWSGVPLPSSYITIDVGICFLLWVIIQYCFVLLLQCFPRLAIGRSFSWLLCPFVVFPPCEFCCCCVHSLTLCHCKMLQICLLYFLRKS